MTRNTVYTLRQFLGFTELAQYALPTSSFLRATSVLLLDSHTSFLNISFSLILPTMSQRSRRVSAKWSDEEIQYIIDRDLTHTAREIARGFNDHFAGRVITDEQTKHVRHRYREDERYKRYTSTHQSSVPDPNEQVLS